MAEKDKGGKGKDCPGAGDQTGMAFGGAVEDGLFPGPWLEPQGEGSPLWGWIGDEETFPLLIPDEGESHEPEKVLAAPCDVRDINPFG